MVHTKNVEGCVVRVLVPLALPTVLDYLCAEPCAAGDWVEIPVGKRGVDGVVIEVLAESVFGKLKTARRRGDVPPLSTTTLAFYRWVARYTLSAPGEPLRVGLPQGRVPAAPRVPKANKKVNKKEIAAPSARNDGFAVLGALSFEPVALNAAQAAAAGEIGAALGGFKVFLLDGVTGSGKTEVYFKVMEQVLQAGGQALVLVPEIALTPQWLKRFEQRFGVAPLVWHSGLAAGAKRAAWWALARGEARVVVGARSSLFLPFSNLQLVVVDEEHEPSYKQDEAFRYHARDMAVQAANLWKCPVVLASATPSLETWQRVREGKYARLVLPERHGGTVAPVKMVDLRNEKGSKQDYIGGELRGAVGAALGRGEQALLFLNRRGNAPLLMCRDCGNRRDCPRCDASLVVHGDKLQCHHCGFAEPYPDACVVCGSGELRAYGPGTRRVVLEAQKLWPQGRIAVADSDAVSGPKQLGELVRQIEAREVDVIVGTQMVTKGHHFPHLTCVGVIDADMGLAHGELRAAERTFQLLTQVAGRAGRGTLPGVVWVQSHDPTHPLFEALVRHDRDGFYALELEARRAFGDPPFGRQVMILLDGLEEREVQAAGAALVKGFPATEGVRVLGPAPAPMARVRERWKYRVLVKSAGHGPLQPLVKAWVESVALPRGVRVMVDVDPS